MSALPRSTFAGVTHPFTGQALTQAGRLPKIAPMKRIDLAKIEITNTPLPLGRSALQGKYNTLFASMQPGQCIECDSDVVGAISNSAIKWVRTHRPDLMVRSAKLLDGKPGRGGVWLLAAPEGYWAKGKAKAKGAKGVGK